MRLRCFNGFSLIEVLLALAVISIALTALLQSMANTVSYTQRLEEKALKHWVAMQGIAMAQLDLLPQRAGEILTEKTKILGQTWYWRVSLGKTPLKKVKKIQISLSKNQAGPFVDSLIGFKYESGLI